MCHTQPADDGVRRSSHPNPGTSISMTTSRAPPRGTARRTSTRPRRPSRGRRGGSRSCPSSVTSPWMRLRHGVGVVAAPRLARIAETGQVDGDHGEVLGERGHHAVPCPPRLRPAVEQDERRPLPADRRNAATRPRSTAIRRGRAPRRRRVGRGRTRSASRSSRCPLRRSQFASRASATPKRSLNRARPVSVKYLIISPGTVRGSQPTGGGPMHRSRGGSRRSSRSGARRARSPFALAGAPFARARDRRGRGRRRSRAMTTERRGRARGAAHGQRLPDRAGRRRPDPPRPLRARHPRAHGTNVGMRHVVLRRVHRAPRRPIGEVVHRARGAGARSRGHDDRGARRRRHAAPDAAGVPDPPRAAVRVLHARDGHGRGLAGDRARRPRRATTCASGSRATSADAPGTRTSSPRSSPAPGRCRSRAGPRTARHRRDPGTVLVRPRRLGRRSAGRARASTATTPSSSPAAIRCCP